MKILIFTSILFCAIAWFPAHAELTAQDLDKIRLIVQDEIKKELSISETRIKEYIDLKIEGVDKQFQSVDKQFQSVDKQFQSVDKQFQSVDRQIAHVTYVTYGLIALIVAAIGIPQIIIAWRSENGKDQAKQIQELRQEIDALKQQQIINP
ncbi:MAG: hypothetical protein OXC79_02140 [Candidatus Poribacteria bacterium]|nr:hypothetical protein [Candidatus Poribacteria bacterium]